MLYICIVRFDIQESQKILQMFFRKLGHEALFSSENISDFGTVALLFVCGKYYPIID